MRLAKVGVKKAEKQNRRSAAIVLNQPSEMGLCTERTYSTQKSIVCNALFKH